MTDWKADLDALVQETMAIWGGRDRETNGRRTAQTGKPVDEEQVHRDGPSAENLNSLRLALATFALKLNAFEARLKLRRRQTRKQATEPDLAPGPAAISDFL